jgi:hypothetical protein
MSVLLFTSLIPIIVVIFIIMFVINIVRRFEHRAEERLKLDKENIKLQQQQMQEINKRLTNIENILNEID